MVEVQQVHPVLAIPLLHMSLLEGQHLEVEVVVADSPPPDRPGDRDRRGGADGNGNG